MSPPGKRVLIAGLAALGVAAVVYLVTRGSSSAPGPETSGAAATDAGAEAGTDAGAASDADPPTLARAIARARPLMTDRLDGSSGGTLVLLGWSTRHLGWSDVAVDQDETSWERVIKSSDGERGKRVCVTGTILAVNPVRTDAALFWNGVLGAAHDHLFAFSAVGGMGSLEAGGRARLCGVVTGRTETREGSGRPTPAVAVVGMFDVPENHGLEPR
jgi:hypothetical protein